MFIDIVLTITVIIGAIIGNNTVPLIVAIAFNVETVLFIVTYFMAKKKPSYSNIYFSLGKFYFSLGFISILIIGSENIWTEDERVSY